MIIKVKALVEFALNFPDLKPEGTDIWDSLSKFRYYVENAINKINGEDFNLTLEAKEIKNYVKPDIATLGGDLIEFFIDCDETANVYIRPPKTLYADSKFEDIEVNMDDLEELLYKIKKRNYKKDF